MQSRYEWYGRCRPCATLERSSLKYPNPIGVTLRRTMQVADRRVYRCCGPVAAFTLAGRPPRAADAAGGAFKAAIAFLECEVGDGEARIAGYSFPHQPARFIGATERHQGRRAIEAGTIGLKYKPTKGKRARREATAAWSSALAKMRCMTARKFFPGSFCWSRRTLGPRSCRRYGDLTGRWMGAQSHIDLAPALSSPTLSGISGFLGDRD